MKNNDMIEYKNNIFFRIKNYFINLFKRKKEIEIIEENDCLKNNTIKENDFFEELKFDINTNKMMDREMFLKYIDGNVDALNKLSVDRLKKIKEYYDETIEKNENIIKKLKASE